MINKIEFSARNLNSNAGLFLLLEHARRNGIFDLIDHDLVFETQSTKKTKMNHIKTMLCGNFIGIDKLERQKLLQSDPRVNEFAISIKEPEMVSWFWETSASPTKRYHLFDEYEGKMIATRNPGWRYKETHK